MWYPKNPEELEKELKEFLSETSKIKTQKIHGLVVPHAGYSFSGSIAGKAFSLLKNSEKTFEKAIILAPSHYKAFKGIASIEKIETPLGKVEIEKNDYEKIDYEHAIDNQIPFLQYIFNNKIEILPLVIGNLNLEESEKFARELIKEIDNKTILIVSTDLSHFLPYEEAVEIDKHTIEIIKNLDLSSWKEIDACGIFPILILMQLCKIKHWQPELIEYKNSGDIIPKIGKDKVVGYASFVF